MNCTNIRRSVAFQSDVPGALHSLAVALQLIAGALPSLGCHQTTLTKGKRSALYINCVQYKWLQLCAKQMVYYNVSDMAMSQTKAESVQKEKQENKPKHFY